MGQFWRNGGVGLLVFCTGLSALAYAGHTLPTLLCWWCRDQGNSFIWSFMLALRARGVGSAWTTLHIMFEQEAAALLGIPPTVTQAALLPVAYYTGGEFKPAKRLPARDQTHWNAWGRR